MPITRMPALCIMALLIFVAVGCCATTSSVAPPVLVSEDVMVPTADTGSSLFMRNKAPAGMKSFSAEKTVLFVHGATYPSEITFDLKLGNQSWMDYIASHGYDV